MGIENVPALEAQSHAETLDVSYNSFIRVTVLSWSTVVSSTESVLLSAHCCQNH